MRNERDGSDEERELLELLSQSALKDYPNPERIGCPERIFLVQLATNRKSISLRDPRLDHVLHCSPCFRQFTEFRQQAAGKTRNWHLAIGVSVAIAAMILVALGFWLLNVSGVRRHRPDDVIAGTPLVVQLSLEDRAIVRGAPKYERPREPRIPRGNLQLTVLLPFGSYPGNYQVQILRDVDAPLISGSGNARISDGSTKLEVAINTSTLSSGRYLLGIREPSLAWTYNPIFVQ